MEHEITDINASCVSSFSSVSAERTQRDGRARKKDESAKKERKGDYLVKVIAVQTLVCALILAAVFAVNKVGGGLLADFSDILLGKISTSITAAQAKSAFKYISEILPSSEPQTQSVGNVLPEISEPEDTSAQEESSLAEPSDVPVEATLPAVGGADIKSGGTPAAAGTSFSRYEMSCAITVPVSGAVTSPFGYRTHPIDGTYGFHTGIDIAANEGDTIRAAYGGTVSETGFSKSGGNYVKIDHGNGVATGYYHCSEIYVQQGTVVREGEKIAAAGSTGISTGSHLHFELLINGVRYDPLYALKAANAV